MKMSRQKSSLILSIRNFTLRVLIIGIAGVLAVGIFDRIVLMNTIVNKISEYSLSYETKMIKTEVQNVHRLIRFGIKHNNSREEILNEIRGIRFGAKGDGYISISSYDGMVILDSMQRELEGKNLWETADPNGVMIIQEQHKAIEKPEGDFIYYSWNKPSTSEISPKATFVMGIPEWEWMIAAGVYLDNIEEDISSQKKMLYRKFLVRALLFLLFLLLILQYIFRNFRKFTSFTSKEVYASTKCIEESTSSNNEINLDKIYYKEFMSAAREINRIIRARLQADEKTRNTEKRLLLQRQLTPLAYLRWDAENKIVEWNPSAERIFGYTREETIGKDLDIIVPLMDLPKVEEVFTNLRHYNKVSKHYVNKNITKDGRIITCEWHNTHLIDDNGKSLGIVTIGQDISERISTQIEISKKNIELEKSLEEKDILLKEVHHRVKNNLAIISSLLSLQSMDIDNSNLQVLLQSSQNRIKSMALVHELLYKSESLKNINLKQYVNELIDSLIDSNRSTVNQIMLKIDIADSELELDLLIPLGMLINEIISNSFKYAFDNCTSPELSVSLLETGNSTLYMNIRDNGSGFDIDKVPGKSGSIGLMLIEGLIAQINGNLKLSTENGTEYEISFLK